MNSIISTYEIIRKNLFRSETKIRNHYFKEYFMDSVLLKHPYKLLTTKHDHSDSIDTYIHNDTLPEYSFIDLTNNRKFFVDTYHQPVWLGTYPHQYLDPIKKEKLLLYQKYDAICRLFMAITVGGSQISGKPLESYFVPVRYLKSGNKLFRKMIHYFVIRNVDVSFDEYSSPLSSNDLWRRFEWKNYTTSQIN